MTDTAADDQQTPAPPPDPSPAIGGRVVTGRAHVDVHLTPAPGSLAPDS